MQAKYAFSANNSIDEEAAPAIRADEHLLMLVRIVAVELLIDEEIIAVAQSVDDMERRLTAPPAPPIAVDAVHDAI